MRFVGKKTSWTKTFVNLKSFPKITVAYTPSAKKKAGIGYEDIVREVQAGTFKPIYYLCGEESYYIDRLADFIADKAVAPEDRDFNLTVLYGADITVDTIIAAARRRSMLGGRQAIVVKEAQNVKNLDRLELDLKQPLDTTRQTSNRAPPKSSPTTSATTSTASPRNSTNSSLPCRKGKSS